MNIKSLQIRSNTIVLPSWHKNYDNILLFVGNLTSYGDLNIHIISVPQDSKPCKRFLIKLKMTLIHLFSVYLPVNFQNI